MDANLIFVVDSSASVSDSNFNKARTFIAEFANAFKPQAAAGGFKMGLVSFADTAVVNVGLTPNMDTIVNTVSTMTHLKGNTNTRLAYTTAAAQLAGTGGSST
jgi:uncharacterized protein YegL